MPFDPYIRKGVTKVYFVPTIAVKTLPTVAEIVTGGTRLDEFIAEVNGLSYENSPVPIPRLSSSFDASIPGSDSVADTSLAFYEPKTGTDTVKAATPKGQKGYLVVFYRGTAGAAPAAADKCDVWPVQVASHARRYSAGNDPATTLARFAPTDTPAEDASVAA